MSRAWPTPDWSRTLHCIGDPHIGDQAMTAARMEIFADDLERLPVVPRVILGDLSDSGAVDDAAALAWAASLPGDEPAKVIGNHDLWNGPRTTADVVAAWGLSAKDYTVDLGFALLAVLGPDAMDADAVGLQYNATALNWLNGVLGGATKPVVIAAHPPLRNTEGKLSFRTAFSAQPDTTIRAMLDDWTGTRSLAWVSGHTHSHHLTPDIAKEEPLGAGKIVTLNCQALSHLDGARRTSDPIATMWLTVTDTEWQVRARDHGAHQWAGIGATRTRCWTAPL